LVDDFAGNTKEKAVKIIRFPGKPATVPDPRASLGRWQQAHDEQLRLCNELEDIADSLPSTVNRQKCIYAAKALGPLIRGVHHFEDNILFPSFEARMLASPDFAKTLARLKFEHFEDECFADELAERLLMLGIGRGEINMEATGYMLRGFFESVRRHIAFERDYFATLGLTEEAPSERH
jgi:hemerythrin-like domain-containing protein